MLTTADINLVLDPLSVEPNCLEIESSIEGNSTDLNDENENILLLQHLTDYEDNQVITQKFSSSMEFSRDRQIKINDQCLRKKELENQETLLAIIKKQGYQIIKMNIILIEENLN